MPACVTTCSVLSAAVHCREGVPAGLLSSVARGGAAVTCLDYGAVQHKRRDRTTRPIPTGLVCPVRNETDNTCYKNVSDPKRAVDFETVA